MNTALYADNVVIKNRPESRPARSSSRRCSRKHRVGARSHRKETVRVPRAGSQPQAITVDQVLRQAHADPIDRPAIRSQGDGDKCVAPWSSSGILDSDPNLQQALIPMNSADIVAPSGL